MGISGQHGRADAGIDCVFLTCFESEVEVYSILLKPSGIRIHVADTLERVEFLLIVTNATVVLSDALFLDGSWQEAAAMVERLHPGVAVVLALPEEDDAARALALENGQRLMIDRPLRMGALRSAIEAAHRDRLGERGSPGRRCRPASDVRT